MDQPDDPRLGLVGQLEELDDDVCRGLLASRTVGRLVWNGGDGISVITVNFALDEEDVLVRLAPRSRAARECDGAAVAFHVDRADSALRSGWSVLARGHASVDLTPAVQHEGRVDVWPEGTRPVLLRLEVERLFGRRLGIPI